MKPKNTSKIRKLKLSTILKIASIRKERSDKDDHLRTITGLRGLKKEKVNDLRTFLTKQANIDKFRQFLEKQFCSENLEFYLACDRFYRLDKDKAGKEMIKFMANQIYNDFLGENARQPVNLDYQCLQNIRWQIKNPSQDLFCDAQIEIFNLMESDCYPRFLKDLKMDNKIVKKKR